MGKPYEHWKYLFPPRPSVAILPQQMASFQERGWVVQKKKNGTCAVIGLGPNGETEVWNRHQELVKRWSMPRELRTILHAAGGPGWRVIVGELLHNKVSRENGGVKDTLYLFDVLVWRGEYLLGMEYRDRLNLLYADVNLPPVRGVTPGSHLEIHPNLWLTVNLEGSAAKRFEEIQPGGIDEGLVLKNPLAKLEECSIGSANSRYSVKCRYGTKNYSH